DKWYRSNGTVRDDQEKIRALGFDRTTQQFEEMAQRDTDLKDSFENEFAIRKLVLHTLLDVVAKWTEGSEQMSRMQAISYKNLFHGRAPDAEKFIDDAIERANATGSDIVRLGPSTLHVIAESSSRIADLVDGIPETEAGKQTFRDIVNQALAVAKAGGG